jgi:Thiamine pyrophosphokinase
VARCVLVGGACIADYERANGLLRPDDFFVFCDGGLSHLPHLKAVPDLIVGDFDSHSRPDTGIETIVFPREKDDTDSVCAAKEAVRRGFVDFLLLGMTGGRLDHTLGNLSLLLWLHSLGNTACLADDFSEMQIVSREK